MKKRITFTWDEETIEELKDASDKTMIAQARIAEKAVKEYIEKLNKNKINNKKPLS